MGQVLHGSATTTEAIRRAIQHSQESLRALAKRYGINQKTVAKWKKRTSVADLPTGPKEPRSTVLSVEEEAVIVAFRRHTLLPLDDCLYALQPTIPHLTRSSLHRCLQRHGICRLPEVEGDKPAKKKFKSYPIGYFHIDIAEVRTDEGKLHLFVAIDRTSKFAFVELHEKATTAVSRRLPAAPDRGRPLQDPHRAHRQRHPLHHARRRRLGRAADQGGDRKRRTLPGACLRIRLRQERHRSSADQAQAPMDQRPGRKDEPHHQGRDRQTLLLRDPRPAPTAISPTSSAPTTSPAGSRPSKASRPTSSSAKPGHPSPNASPSTRSSKCRD